MAFFAMWANLRRLHAAPQAVGGHFVAAPESLAVFMAALGRDIWVAILFAIGYIGATMVAEILAGPVHAVVESAALPLAETVRRRAIARISAALPRTLSP